MIVAAGLHHRQHAERADGFLARLADVQVLQAPAHLLAGDRFAFAELLLSGAHRLHPQDGRADAAHVVHGADAVAVRQVTFAGLVELLVDLVHHRVAAGCVEGHRAVAFGGIAGRHGVFLGPRPPDAEHFLAREAIALRCLDRHRVHRAPAPQDHVIRLGLADLQPLRLLLGAGRRHGNLDQLKAVLFGQRLQHRQGFLAEGRVVVQVDDLFPLSLSMPPFLSPRYLIMPAAWFQ